DALEPEGLLLRGQDDAVDPDGAPAEEDAPRAGLTGNPCHERLGTLSPSPSTSRIGSTPSWSARGSPWARRAPWCVAAPRPFCGCFASTARGPRSSSSEKSWPAIPSSFAR